MSAENEEFALDHVKKQAALAAEAAANAKQSKEEAEKIAGVIFEFAKKISELKDIGEKVKNDPVLKGKPLGDYISDYDYYTAKTSEIIRNLALAGIAIIWLFRNPDDRETLFADTLLYPLWFLIISLSLDLLQYILGALFWGLFYEYKYHLWKRKGKLSDEDIKDVQAPNSLSIPLTIIFYAKIGTTIFAYYDLFIFMQSRIASS